MTINEAAEAWLAHLTAQELKPGTVEVYRRDIEKFVESFGGDKDLTAITALRVNGYLKSNRLLKSPTGKVLAKPTVDRSKRVARMFLEFCASAGHVAEPPTGVINLLKS